MVDPYGLELRHWFLDFPADRMSLDQAAMAVPSMRSPTALAATLSEVAVAAQSAVASEEKAVN